MTLKQKIEYLKRMQESMRAMTSEEIAAMQARDDLAMHARPMSNGDAGRNFWAGIAPVKPAN